MRSKCPECGGTGGEENRDGVKENCRVCGGKGTVFRECPCGCDDVVFTVIEKCPVCGIPVCEEYDEVERIIINFLKDVSKLHPDGKGIATDPDLGWALRDSPLRGAVTEKEVLDAVRRMYREGKVGRERCGWALKKGARCPVPGGLR